MQKIAITGTIGAGKSTVGQLLEKKGISFISADALTRQAIAPHTPGYSKLLKLLGPEYLNTNGCFNTQKMATIAFRNNSLLRQIESIVLPIILELMRKKEKTLYFSGEKVVFYEIPLLFEKKWEHLFDIRIVVATDPEKQKNRLKKYRNLSLEEVNNRMQHQMSQEEKIKKADYTIWNNSSLKELEKQTFGLIDSITTGTEKKAT